MEDRKYVKYIIPAILVLGFLFSQATLAYDGETHAYLTREIFDFYNQRFPQNKIDGSLLDYLTEGARREDDIPRWMNHFYDPVNNKGLTSVYGNGYASKIWANDAEKQNETRYKTFTAIASALTAVREKKISALTTETDFTWKKAVDLYVKERKEEAFFVLGHVLHLVEDAAVPEHTRNDAHPGIGEDYSPYERYTKSFSLSSPDNNLKNRLENKPVIPANSLNNYFNSMAFYTNKNFYSKDTIDNYDKPKEDYIKQDGIYFYGFKNDEENNKYHLIAYNNDPNRYGWLNTKPTVEEKKQSLVLQDYWSLLSVKAVQHGAGVMDLFFKEVAREKVKEQTEQKSQSFFAALIETVGNLFSPDNELTVENFEETTPAIQLENNQTNIVIEDGSVGTTAFEENPQEPKILPEPPLSVPNPTLLEPVSEQSIPPSLPIYSASNFLFALANPLENSSPSAPVIVTPNPSPETSSSTDTASSTEEETATSTPPEPPIPPPLSAADHVVVSEIRAGGENAGDEFIELYNPTTSTVSFFGWSIQYVSGNATSTKNVYKKNFEDGQFIVPRGFFLIARELDSSSEDGYRGEADLTHRSFSLSQNGARIFLVRNQEKIEGFDDPDIVDGVEYESLENYQSFERKAFVGEACVSSQSEGEFLGNGCDLTGTLDDFELRSVAKSQNASNLPEPRETPAVPVNVSLYQNITSTTMSLNLNWDASVSADIFYSIKSGGDLIATTTDLTWNRAINEVGREYSLSLQSVDRDGLASAEIGTSINTPSFLANVGFYSSSTGTSSVKYYLDLAWNDYPFIPLYIPHPAMGIQQKWHVVLFQINKEFSLPSLLNKGIPDYWGEVYDAGLKIKYPNCIAGWSLSPGIIFPDTAERCDAMIGGTPSHAIHWDALYNNQLTLELPAGYFASTPQAGDYLTLGFYTYQPSASGEPQKLVATDKTKYFFEAR